MERRDPVLAIDIGGTKMAAGLVEPGGRLASWAQTETPRAMEAEPLGTYRGGRVQENQQP